MANDGRNQSRNVDRKQQANTKKMDIAVAEKGTTPTTQAATTGSTCHRPRASRNRTRYTGTKCPHRVHYAASSPGEGPELGHLSRPRGPTLQKLAPGGDPELGT